MINYVDRCACIQDVCTCKSLMPGKEDRMLAVPDDQHTRTSVLIKSILNRTASQVFILMCIFSG